MSTPLLQMRGISKRFGAVQALTNVNFSVNEGTVHALIGENGAGKSTLMKILSGSIKQDAGEIEFAGAPYHPEGPKQARNAGVSMIYQELTLAPHLTVEENITLGVERHTFGFLKHQWRNTASALALLGHESIDLKTPVHRLSIGQQQLVEIARSLLLKSRLIIMDEPTSSLSGEDTRSLFEAIRRLRDQGITVIYISHFLEEIREIADEFTVLRDGQLAASGVMNDTSLQDIVTHMVGRPLDEMFPRVEHKIGDTLFSVRNIEQPKVNNVSFDVRQGEIFGIAGIIGAGRTELLRTIYGLDPGRGELVIGGHHIDIQSPSYHPNAAIKAGISMMSENRKEEGLAIDLPIVQNVSMSSLRRLANSFGRLFIDKETAYVAERVEQLGLKYDRLTSPVSSLSGGNQQKVALARLLLEASQILLLDEPTRGIDVMSKVEIYRLIGSLAAQGRGIIMVSSYLPELFGICDTLAVMHRGRLSPKKEITEWTTTTVMHWATMGRLE